MSTFRPKEVFSQAQQAEAEGKNGEAAGHYASLSAYLRRRGKLDEAYALIRKAIGLAPQVSRLQLHLALIHELRGETENADAALSEFTERAIERKKTEQYRDVVESTLKDAPRLRTLYFDRLLQLDRTSAASFLGRARALAGQGDEAGAIKVLTDALQTRTHDEEVLSEMESLLRSAGRSEGLIHLVRFREGKIALENFVLLLTGPAKQTVDEEPQIASTGEKNLRDLIQELEKEIGSQLEKPQEEIAPLLKEFRRRSQPVLGNDCRAHMDMALAFFEMGLLKEAQEEIDTVPETNVLYAEAQALLGEIFLSTGSDLSALDAFQKCLRSQIKTSDVDKEAHYKLVQVFFRLGDLRKAFSEVEELEKKAPNYRDLRFLKRQIQEALEKCAD